MEIKDCSECRFLKVMAESDHTLAVGDELKTLTKEHAQMLDDGMDWIEAQIIFKNRLWQMEEGNVDRNTPQYQALKMVVDGADRFFAENWYKTQGWQKKHSGEWVKKNKEQV